MADWLVLACMAGTCAKGRGGVLGVYRVFCCKLNTADFFSKYEFGNTKLDERHLLSSLTKKKILKSNLPNCFWQGQGVRRVGMALCAVPALFDPVQSQSSGGEGPDELPFLGKDYI